MTRSCDAGELELGGGLEVLLAAVLESMSPNEVVNIKLLSRSSALELPGWARQTGHDVVEAWTQGERDQQRFVVQLRKGSAMRILARELPPRGEGLALRGGTSANSADLREGEPPQRLNPRSGFIPLGAIAEAGGPSFDWGLNERDHLWAREIADLTERATSAQWDATVDIPWAEARGLPDEIEIAVAQVMTYIAQNEYAALYVPARFLSQVNPGYVEVLLWLSSHVHDEARHVEVFTKRALVGGASSYALASTELSLHTLLDEHDSYSAALLLNVLGEGTFLDLLRFVERYAPDPATAAAARLAHRDEQRHVHFGISHVRRVLRLIPSEQAKLIGAVEARAAKLTSLTGLSSLLIESLTLMVAGSLSPPGLGSAATEVRRFMNDLETNRIRRLRAAGFSQENARYLSDLHTPNLM